MTPGEQTVRAACPKDKLEFRFFCERCEALYSTQGCLYPCFVTLILKLKNFPWKECEYPNLVPRVFPEFSCPSHFLREKPSGGGCECPDTVMSWQMETQVKTDKYSQEL